MDYLTIFCGVGTFTSIYYLIKNKLNLRDHKRLLEMLNSNKISHIDEIMANFNNPNNIPGNFLKGKNGEFTVLVKGNLGLRGHSPFKVKNELRNGEETNVLLKVRLLN